MWDVTITPNCRDHRGLWQGQILHSTESTDSVDRLAVGAKTGRRKGFSSFPCPCKTSIVAISGSRESFWEKEWAREGLGLWQQRLMLLTFSHPAPNPYLLVTLKTVFVSWSLPSCFCVNYFLTKEESSIPGKQTTYLLLSKPCTSQELESVPMYLCPGKKQSPMQSLCPATGWSHSHWHALDW